MAFTSAKNTAGGMGAQAMSHGKKAGRKAKDGAGRDAKQADNSRALEMLARIGFVVLGVLHLIIGWLAIRIATGDSGGEEASNSGPLAEIAEAPGGKILLWVAVAGLVVTAGVVVLGVGLYSIWNGATKGFKDDLEAGAESGHVGTAIVVVGVGAALYGLYSIARAKYVSR